MGVDRQDEANDLFSRFGDRAQKYYVLGRVCLPSDLVIMKVLLRRIVERGRNGILSIAGYVVVNVNYTFLV